MEYRILGRDPGRRVSVVGFGCGRRAGLMAGTDRRAQADVVARALDLGVTLFDTAPLYGSERNLGSALRAAGRITEAVIVSKVELASPDDGEAHVLSSVEASLERLGVERLDVVMLHNRVFDPGCRARPVDAPGPAVTAGELGRAGGPLAGLLTARRRGLVGAIGLTGLGSDPEPLRTILADAPCIDVLTVEYNLAHASALAQQACGALDDGGPEHPDVIAAARAAGVSLIGLRPLLGGVLAAPPGDCGDAPSPRATPDLPAALQAACAGTDSSPASAAWRFACRNPDLVTVLGGFRHGDDLETAVAGAAGAGGEDAVLDALGAAPR